MAATPKALTAWTTCFMWRWVMINQAKDIVTAVEKDGSWGVHAPEYTLKKAREAETLVKGAQASLK